MSKFASVIRVLPFTKRWTPPMKALKRLMRTATARPVGSSRIDQARASTTKRGFPGGWGMPRMWPVAMYSLVSQNAVVGARVSA